MNVRITVKHGRNVKSTFLAQLDVERDADKEEILEAAVEDGIIDEIDVDFVKKIERLSDEDFADAENAIEDEEEDEEEEEETDDSDEDEE